MEMCSILMGFFLFRGNRLHSIHMYSRKQFNRMEIFLYFAAFLKVVRLVPTQNSISAKYQPIVQPWCLENKHKDTHMALSITSCHQQQIKTFTVTQRQEKSAGQKNLGGSREPRCGRVQGERWHASWVWGKTDDSQIAKMDLRLPIWRISSSLTDLLCLSVCQHPAVQAAIH